MIFQPAVLNEAQKTLLPALGRFAADNGFSLGGGTAVALYLGHRSSIDFDWFLTGPLEDSLGLAEQARSRGLSIASLQIAPGTLHAVIQNVRVSFFQYLYPCLEEPTVWPEYGIKVASLDDLSCMKLAAIAQRGSRKDFIDLYFIALRHKPLQTLFDLYRRKYAIDDITHLLLGLAYFDDADEEPSPLLLLEASWEAIKDQFREWVKPFAP
jgi:hypothetical protein